MTRAAEHLILVNDVFGVGGHEDFARFAKVELFRMIAEEFAVNRAPDETTVRVDVDLRNAEFGGGQILFFIDAAGVFHRAARVVDALNPFLRNGGTSVHDEREVRLDFVDGLLNLFQHVEVKTLLAGELESAVGSSDRDRERVDAGLLNEFSRLFRIRQLDASDDVFFNAAELSEFRFDDDALGVSAIDDALRNIDVLRELFVRSVDHDGAIETGIDAVVADVFSAVIEVDGEDRFREDLVGGADHAFEEVLIGVGTSAAGNLDDEGSAFRIVVRILVRGGFAKVAAEKTDELLEIVDVIGADSVLAISFLKQVFCRNDH